MKGHKKTFCFMTIASRSSFIVQKRQAKTLIENGFRVYILVSDDLPNEEVEGINYISVGSNKGYLNRVFYHQNKIYKYAAKIDADIYQTESPDLVFTCLKLKRKGKEVYFNLLEGHPYTLYKKSKLPRCINKILLYLMILSMKFVFKRINAIFAVSEDILNYLYEWGVGNAYLLGNYPLVNEDYVLSKEDYMKRNDRIVYYGHIPRESKTENFLKAVQNINVKYLIAGKFWENSYYEELRGSMYWSSNVEFINGFRRNELSKILSSCTISNTARDLSESASPNGSLGILKIFESMEYALPVIFLDVPVYREIVEKYNCGILVDIFNEESIKEGIRFLIENKEKAYIMGQNGRKAVLEKYSWNAESKKYMQIIRSTIN